MIKYIGYGVAFILVIDVMGFIAWKLSDQKPVDNFHAGVITESILEAF